MLDCLVVGAGHSGLLCARMLDEHGLNYSVADESARIGDVWRRRPKNLRLFTSRQFCALGDFEMQGDPKGFAAGTEFADHLEQFALTKGLRIALSTRVRRLSRDGDGFVAELSSGETVRARTVINATGSNQEPIVPEYAAKLSALVHQTTALGFGSAANYTGRQTIAVVGDGASGRQIARELSPSHQVTLARGRVRKLVPNRVLGQDIFWWLSKLGILFAPTNSTVAKLLRKRDPIPAKADNDARLAAAGVMLRGEAVDAAGQELIFDDGTRQHFDAVVWCVGYREQLDWVDLPRVKQAPNFAGSQGKSAEPGFFVVGRKWLSCRASELVLGAEKDAARVVAEVVSYCRSARQNNPGKEVLANV